MAYVLVVDDAADVCRVMAALLRVIGHDSHCVSGGSEALAYLERTVPDLIILDVMMPELDGPAVLRLLRDQPEAKAIPVVMYSALNDPGIRNDMLSLGADDFWVKGEIDPTFVELRINALLALPAERVVH